MTTNSKARRTLLAVTVGLLGCAPFATVTYAAPPVSRSILATSSSPAPGQVVRSGQMTSQLCWAAVAEMAINAVAPPKPPAPPMTQNEQAALRFAPSNDPTVLDEARMRCANIGECSFTSTPVLEPFVIQKQQTGPLTKAQIEQEIGVFGKPFIFAWEYPAAGDDPDAHPVGKHYLIATGYNKASTTGYLEVVDPWPKRDDVDDQFSGGAVVPVSFEAYAMPEVDMGLPTAYDETFFQLRSPNAPPAPNPPSNVTVVGSTGVQSPRDVLVQELRNRRKVHFTRAADVALSPEQRVKALAKPRPWLAQERAPLEVGVPFPIVALRVRDVVRANSDTTRLITSETDAMLYPVMARGRVVDSFLMVRRNGIWVQKGYSNPVVTARLVAVRQSSAELHKVGVADYFLISLPEISGFFASYRSGKEIWAIPSATDPSIGAVRGVQQPAGDVFRRIVEASEKRAPTRQ